MRNKRVGNTDMKVVGGRGKITGRREKGWDGLRERRRRGKMRMCG